MPREGRKEKDLRQKDAKQMVARENDAREIDARGKVREQGAKVKDVVKKYATEKNAIAKGERVEIVIENHSIKRIQKRKGLTRKMNV